MIKKNVYLLYPAGYGGSYINWAISISDLDSRKNTVQNPINTVNSTKFGGHGTTHHHVRIPTHQGFDEHLNWVIYNRPTTPLIYIINTNNQDPIKSILHHDPDGICINIHDNNDSIVGSYGLINMVTKWPTFLHFNINYINTDISSFDPWNCGKNREFRNGLADGAPWTAFSDPNKPVDYLVLDQQIKCRQRWYDIRNKYQPHEVNEATYLTNINYKDRIFELSCLDIASTNFLTIFADIMNRSGVSNSYDLEYINQFHHNYIDAQLNLQWVESIRNWRATKQLDSYLTSHGIIEACLIKEIFKVLNIQTERDIKKWKNFYSDVKDPSWPECNESNDFYKLPSAIQTELINNFNYQPTPELDSLTIELKNNWKTWDIGKINDAYQEITNKEILV
jgi:hypothetical protein